MKVQFTGLLALSIMFFACEATPPSEAEVKSLIVGEYCDEDQVYKLQLDDSTYFHRKAEPGVLTSRSLSYESCSGLYELIQEGNTWKIHFLPDDRPRNSLFKNCERIVDLWNPREGYLIGDESIYLPDLFESNALTKGLCE